MRPLSIVILTKNEERNIIRCVKPLLALSDDVLVLDNGSEDATIELAKQSGVRVESTSWVGYSETKNKGNQLAKYDWILSLDADEEVNQDLVDALKKLFENEVPNDTAYYIRRKLIYCGKLLQYGSVKNEYRLRLFNRKNGAWNQNQVHEDLVFSSPVKKLKLDGFAWHHSYHSAEEHLKKLETYAKLSSKQMYLQGKKATFIKCYLSPLFGFFKNYVYRLGFLDGAIGFQYASESMWYTKRKYQLLKEAIENRR
ncbi:MAG: glycosyltransferase family 2 protein [Chitinophagaceae bacterium]|nr:glycosyltransferase family 2 protein [Chitinophagaceae bacterium]